DWGTMADFVEVNVRGTRNVLDAAADRRVVHVSSVAGWGYAFSRDLDEGAWSRRTGAPYVDTKAASDELALRRGAAVVRPGDVYGPGSIPWTIRPVEALRARQLVLPGRGDGLMTLVYVDDLVDCIVRALRSEQAGGTAFTAWDGQPVTAREFFGRYAQMLGRRGVPTLPRPLVWAATLGLELLARVSVGPARAPRVSRQAIQYVSRRAVYPNTRARELLGWEPRVDLAEGMRRTEAWLRQTGRL
ncbi:MAG TPA: NAD-dependent epimerase/dehydratase family protein, partial [Capillimicrobium sp.]